MALAPGTRFGPYEIGASIGAGGMGEVYRARDSRLNRDVAIKVLPASVAADDERLRRFTIEAQTAGGLNHPNILAIYDLGSHEGQPYLVAELLQGETLRARLDAGPVPLSKAVDFVRQAAAGLAAAHGSGITHRDIKPENLFVTTDGRVKILDFGLARVEPVIAEGGETRLNTGTAAGIVLGTVGYMSPEQVRGVAADSRSDLFSLGVVLYELLSGRRPFVGDSAVQTMNAVLTVDPPDVATAGRIVPLALEQVVRHCLEKNPEERFQSARDLSFALQSASSASTSRQEALPSERRSARVSMRALVLAAGAIVAVAAFLAGRLLTPAAIPGAPQFASFQQITDYAGVETTPTLSPDGKSLVYVSDATGNDDLYLQRVGGRVAVPLTADSPDDDSQPAFSPDGERIAFRSSRDGGGIFLMNATGESVKRLTDYGFNPSWSPDGREIVVAPSTFTYPTDRGGLSAGLVAVDVATARTRVISTKDDAMQPNWSPHGTRIAYWGLRGNSGQRDLWTIAANGSEADRGGTTVTDDAALDWSPTWAPDGRYLYFSSNRGGTMNLWRVLIDEQSGRVLGDPEPVTTPSTWSGAITFSRDGSQLAFASLDWRSTLFRAAFDATREAIVGAPTPILKSTRPIRDHELSPDGQWVVYNESSPQEDVLVARVDGTQYRRLTDDKFRDRGPSWSPDGQRISFYSDRSGAYEVWIIRPDGSGLERVTAFERANFPVWSPDGRQFAISGVGVGGWYIIDSSARAVPKPPAQPSIDPKLSFWPFSWSPDGSRLAGSAVTAEGGARQIAVYSLTTKRFEWVSKVSSGNWQLPVWLNDGRRLIVRDSSGISIVHPDTGASRPLLSVRGYATGRSAGVSRDGRWITYTETGTEGNIWLATAKKQ